MAAQNTGCGKIVTETKRLIIREMVQSDLDSLCKIMCDAEVMRAAYESAFGIEEVQGWLNRHLKRYKDYGFGLWAVVLKETNEMIGQCGLTLQTWREEEILEIGYLFQKAYWHKGYATEAAAACKKYAFTVLNAKSVYSVIRDTHIASQNVAIRNGMKIIDKMTKISGIQIWIFFCMASIKSRKQIQSKNRESFRSIELLSYCGTARNIDSW